MIIKTSNSNKFSFSIFFTIILLYLLYFINYSKIISDWVIADLLINYQGGFVRRGLLGQLNYFFENYLNFPKLIFIISLSSLCYFINLFLTYRLFISSKRSIFLFLIIFLSPATFLFYIYDLNALFRKDVFIIFSFVIHCFYVQRNLKNKNFDYQYKKNLPYIIIVLCLTTLIYEVQFFMLPIHILLSYVILKNKKLIYIFYTLPIIIFFISCIFKGDFKIAESIRNSLLHYPKNIIYQNYNPIHWLEGNINLAIGGSLKLIFKYNYNQALQILISILLTIILFWKIFSYNLNKFILENKKINIIDLKFIKNNAWKFFLFSSILFFIIGFDTGRLIHIVLMHIISLFLIFNPKNINFFFLYKNLKYKNFIIFFILCYVLLWTLPSGYVGLDTIFKSGLMSVFKIIFSNLIASLSNLISFPSFINELFYEYLIFFNLPKF